jgi:hypothetical protein
MTNGREDRVAELVQGKKRARRLDLDEAEAEEPTLQLPVAPNAEPLPGDPTGYEPTLYGMTPPVGQPAGEPTIPYYGFPTGAPMSGPMPVGAVRPWTRALEPEAGRHDDDFSVSDSYYDLPEILASPRDFFLAQIGREGNRAPLSMLAMYTLNIAIGLLAVLFTAGAQLGPTGMMVVLLSPFAFVLLYTALTAVALGGAALLYGACALFRSRATYSGSFRAAVYAAAPVCTALALGLLLLPIKPHNSLLASLLMALPYALTVVAPIWSVLLLGTACRYIHNLSLQATIVVLLLLAAVCIGCGFAFSLLPVWT